MCVLLGLRDAQLTLSGLGHGLSESIGDLFLVEEYVHSRERCVIGSEAAVVERQGMHSLLGHVVLGEHRGELAGSVVAEVEEYHRIALLHPGDRLSSLSDYHGLDELVGDVGVIRSLDRLESRSVLGTLSLDEHVVGLLDAAPALVAIHCIEPSADSGDLSHAFRHLLLELLDEAVTAVGVGVAAVHEAVHIHLVESLLLRDAQELIEVVEAGVYSAVRAEAHEVELAAAGLHIVVRSAYLLVLEELVVAAGHVYLHEVLIYDPAGTEVHVSYLGVAHLAVGQAHIFAAGLQVRHGIFRAEAVDERRALRIDRIGMVVLSFTPTVQNHQ